MRVVLAHHRELGTEFEVAWLSALRSLPKGTDNFQRVEIVQWKEALKWSKGAYRAAYLYEEPPRAALAAELLAADLLAA